MPWKYCIATITAIELLCEKLQSLSWSSLRIVQAGTHLDPDALIPSDTPYKVFKFLPFPESVLIEFSWVSDLLCGWLEVWLLEDLRFSQYLLCCNLHNNYQDENPIFLSSGLTLLQRISSPEWQRYWALLRKANASMSIWWASRSLFW